MRQAPHHNDFNVLIPARMASSRLPNKPLADIAGLPMVVRVAQRAMLSQARQVVVAADDERISDFRQRIDHANFVRNFRATKDDDKRTLRVRT